MRTPHRRARSQMSTALPMSPRALTALTSSLGATLLLTLTLTLTLALTLDPPLGFAESGRRHIAVLDFKNSAQLNTFEVTSLTSIVRGSASRLVRIIWLRPR